MWRLSWPARVSCSGFHLTGHGLPVDSAPLFLCAHHFLSLILSLCGSYLSLSLSLLSPSAFMPDLPTYPPTVSQEMGGMGVGGLEGNTDRVGNSRHERKKEKLETGGKKKPIQRGIATDS